MYFVMIMPNLKYKEKLGVKSVGNSASPSSGHFGHIYSRQRASTACKRNETFGDPVKCKGVRKSIHLVVHVSVLINDLNLQIFQLAANTSFLWLLEKERRMRINFSIKINVLTWKCKNSTSRIKAPMSSSECNQYLKASDYKWSFL